MRSYLNKAVVYKNTNNDRANKIVIRLNHLSKPTIKSDINRSCQKCKLCQNYHQSVDVTGSRFELRQQTCIVGDNRSCNNVHNQDENKA